MPDRSSTVPSLRVLSSSAYSPFQRVSLLLILMSVWGERGERGEVETSLSTEKQFQSETQGGQILKDFGISLKSPAFIFTSCWKYEGRNLHDGQVARWTKKWWLTSWGAWQILVKCWAIFPRGMLILRLFVVRLLSIKWLTLVLPLNYHCKLFLATYNA